MALAVGALLYSFMSWKHLHPDFRLNGQGFADCSDFLYYVQHKLPFHFSFLNDWCRDFPHIMAYTSGSTGKPKAILLPKKAMLYSAFQTISFFNLIPGTSALINLSADYIAGKMMWIRALSGGWHIDVVSPDHQSIQNILKDKHYDFGAMVPLQVQKNLAFISHFKTLIIGGAAVSHHLQTQLKSLPVHIFATYGMTETITHIAVQPLSHDAVADFKLPADTYRVFDGIHISCDERQCLVIEAPNLHSNVIITNDIVELLDNQHFRWLGRFDNVINSGGIKYFPEQLEAKIKPFIEQDFFLGGLPHQTLGEEIVLVVEGKIDSINLKEKLATQLSKYELPKKIISLPVFMRTDSGKIKRNAILQQIKLKNDPL